MMVDRLPGAVVAGSVQISNGQFMAGEAAGQHLPFAPATARKAAEAVSKVRFLPATYCR